jgi:hypothetical protein
MHHGSFVQLFEIVSLEWTAFYALSPPPDRFLPALFLVSRLPCRYGPYISTSNSQLGRVHRYCGSRKVKRIREDANDILEDLLERQPILAL